MGTKRNGVKRRGILVFAAVLSAFCLVALGVHIGVRLQKHNQYCREKADEYAGIAERERRFILENQTPGGAFVTYRLKVGEDGEPEKNSVNPYFSNIAAQALLEGEPGRRETEAVKKYLDWYLDHINTGEEDAVNGAGTIYDHTVYLWEDGTEEAVSKGEYDSVDSYSGTFLWLAADYVKKTQDYDWARGREEELLLVLDALTSCVDGRGMAFGKREHPIRYLMDNCEANAGLKGAQYLLDVALEPAGRLSEVTEALRQNAARFEDAFWNGDEGRYETGFDTHGEPLPFQGFDRLYAEASSQIFPLVWGVASPDDERTRTVYEKLCSHHDWQRMDYVEEGESKFYWTVFGYAGALMEDEERTQEFFLTYAEKTKKSRDYPLHMDDAGWMARAAERMKDMYQGRMVGFSVQKSMQKSTQK